MRCLLRRDGRRRIWAVWTLMCLHKMQQTRSRMPYLQGRDRHEDQAVSPMTAPRLARIPCNCRAQLICLSWHRRCVHLFLVKNKRRRCTVPIACFHVPIACHNIPSPGRHPSLCNHRFQGYCLFVSCMGRFPIGIPFVSIRGCAACTRC